MLFNDSCENDEDSQQEMEGILQKKNRIGHYQNRYFKTHLNKLYYYTGGKISSDNNENPTSIFDISEMSEIIRKGSRLIQLQFYSGDKFKLDLQSSSATLCNEWVQFLLAKRSLYSTSELLEELDASTTFKTKTFGTLMLLHERDRNNYIMSNLNENFQSAADELSVNTRRNDPFIIITGARKCIEEFVRVCEECQLEINSRNPKLIAHCKNYMFKYSNILKGRLMLELSYFLELGLRNLSDLGEKSICASISMMERINELRKYSFIPCEFLSTLNNSLFCSGDLISALLNISIERCDLWFQDILASPISSRSNKLLEIKSIVSDVVKRLEFPINEHILQKDIINKVITTMLLNFSDQFTDCFDISSYDDSNLVKHIKVCHTMIESLPLIVFSTNTYCKELTSNNIEETVELISLPPAVMDAMLNAFNTHARDAVLMSVENIQPTMLPLLELMFNEKHNGWLGGAACSAYIDRLNRWLIQFLSEVPAIYKNLVSAEASLLIIKLFLQKLILCFKVNKKFKLSQIGMEQLDMDLQSIYDWCKLNSNIEDINEELIIISSIREFFYSPGELLIKRYAFCIQNFGLKYSLHSYDLLRLCMKLRVDLIPKTRKIHLGLCAEFLLQFQELASNDLSIYNGTCSKNQKKFRSRNTTHLFDVLSPQASLYHCTGSSWKLEKLVDPLSVRVYVSQIATETLSVMKHASRVKLEISSIPSIPIEVSSTVVIPYPINTLNDTNDSFVSSVTELITRPLSRRLSAKKKSISKIDESEPTVPPTKPRRTSIHFIISNDTTNTSSTGSDSLNTTNSSISPTLLVEELQQEEDTQTKALRALLEQAKIDAAKFDTFVDYNKSILNEAIDIENNIKSSQKPVLICEHITNAPISTPIVNNNTSLEEVATNPFDNDHDDEVATNNEKNKEKAEDLLNNPFTDSVDEDKDHPQYAAPPIPQYGPTLTPSSSINSLEINKDCTYLPISHSFRDNYINEKKESIEEEKDYIDEMVEIEDDYDVGFDDENEEIKDKLVEDDNNVGYDDDDYEKEETIDERLEDYCDDSFEIDDSDSTSVIIKSLEVRYNKVFEENV